MIVVKKITHDIIILMVLPKTTPLRGTTKTWKMGFNILLMEWTSAWRQSLRLRNVEPTSQEIKKEK